MKLVLVYVVVGALVVAGLVMIGPAAVERFNAFLSDRAKIAADTGDPSSATYQRFQARREAVLAMQEDLRSLARAESAFITDSGNPTAYLPPEYGYKTSKGNVGPFIRIEQYAWRAMMYNTHTSMRCTLVAPLDTVTGKYHPEPPDCREQAGAAWDTVLAAEDASRIPDASSARADPPPDPPPVPAPREARPSRDWGPINNTPPPTPYIARKTCQGEGCETTGLWAACSTVIVHKEARRDAPQVAAIQVGERFTALQTDVHVDSPGMIGFRDTVSNPGDEGGEPVDSIRFIPADTLYVLNYHGEGYLVWWYRGQAAEGYQFWDDSHTSGSRTSSVVVLREQLSTKWVHVRNAAGKEGWVVGDYYKMATGGYMDEVERCIRTAKQP